MAYQNSCQTQRNNKEFTQISRQQQLLASIHRALKVTVTLMFYHLFYINAKETICCTSKKNQRSFSAKRLRNLIYLKLEPNVA